MVPGVGAAYSGYVAVKGHDPVAGRCEGLWERLGDGLNAVGGLFEIFHSYGGGGGGGTPLTARQADAAKAIDNILANHLKGGPDGDIAGALRDTLGNPILGKEGRPFDHLNEIKDAYAGFIKRVKALYGATDPNALATRDRALQMIRRLESLFTPSELGKPPFTGN